MDAAFQKFIFPETHCFKESLPSIFPPFIHAISTVYVNKPLFFVLY